MAKEARGLICLALTPERCDELGLDLMAAKNEAPLETAFTVSIEAARGRYDRDLRPRPRAHDPGRDRSPLEARRPAPAGPHLPAEGEAGRGPGAHRPHRGERRSGAARRPDPGRGDLRDHERGRDDGPRSRPGPVLRAPRAEDDHGRRPDRLPAPDREAGRARRRDPTADRVRRVQRASATARWSTTSTTRDGQGRRRRQGGRARARPQRVPHRRRLPQPALRLRRAARGRAGDDRARGARRAPLPLPGGARDRPAQQASRLQAPGETASTRSRRTSSSGCRPTCATTGSAPRSSATSA